ncbi:MAG TPA: peptidylprolyl isomerase, partial [Myxococcota bacterium]|nr:peptidylprolyl isomerase [Myxococcota bacterium]
RWLMPAILIGIGIPFAVYFGAQGATGTNTLSDGVAIRLGDRAIRVNEVQRVVDGLRQQYQQALGDQFEESSARAFLVSTAASGLMRDALLAHLGEEMGLVVSDAEVRAFIRRQPWSLNESGQYDPEQVRRVIADRLKTSTAAFTRGLRDEMLARKAQRLIEASVAVSDGEARDAIRYAQEEVRVIAVRLDGTQPRADLQVPEDAGAKLIAKDGERVRKAVEERRSELDTPEQVRARHILIALPAGADEASRAAAREKLLAAKKRIDAGEDFAAVAQEVSEDAGTKSAGGDLGFFKRGAMVKEFEDAAFSLEPGQLSEPVQTQFGLHLIRVEEKKAASELPYSEASARVAQELARIDAAAAVAKSDADAIAAQVDAGKSLEDATREKGATILRPSPFRRRLDGFIPELGMAPELMNAAFALTPEKPADGTVYTLGENVHALIQLVEKKTPTDAEIEAALPAERERVLGERRSAVEQAWLEGERQRLERVRCLGVVPIEKKLGELNALERMFCGADLVVDLSALLPQEPAEATSAS